MDQRKKNSSLRYFAGFALLIFLAVPVIFAGQTFARYKSGSDKYLQFEVRQPEQICIGTVNENDEFTPLTDGSSLNWVTADDTATLEIAVANGSSGRNFSQKDQKVYIRLIGSLGIMSGEEITEIAIEDETGKKVYAAATQISEGTEYYSSLGEGWLFTFLENGEEYFRILEGGKLSFMKVKITVDTSKITDIASLKLQAEAELTE